MEGHVPRPPQSRYMFHDVSLPPLVSFGLQYHCRHMKQNKDIYSSPFFHPFDTKIYQNYLRCSLWMYGSDIPEKQGMVNSTRILSKVWHHYVLLPGIHSPLGRKEHFFLRWRIYLTSHRLVIRPTSAMQDVVWGYTTVVPLSKTKQQLTRIGLCLECRSIFRFVRFYRNICSRYAAVHQNSQPNPCPFFS